MTSLPAKISNARMAVELAQTPEDHGYLDSDLAELAAMGKYEDASKSQMDAIAEVRIDNLRAMGDKLDVLREAGVIREGRPNEETRSSGPSLPSPKRRKLADELNDWPLDDLLDDDGNLIAAGLSSFKAELLAAEDKELTVHAAYSAAKFYRKLKEFSDAEIESWEHPDVQLFNASFQSVLPKLPASSVGMVFTDPPYANSELANYRDLGKHAPRIMEDGASLIAYFGHFAAPQVLASFPNLRYWWLLAIRHTGGRKVLEGKNVRIHWKPLAWFVKESRGTGEHVDDMIASIPPEPGKTYHPWEQGVGEARYYIRYLSKPGDWILDPMMGSATTGVAALLEGRKFMGIEKDIKRFAKAQARIKECLLSLQDR